MREINQMLYPTDNKEYKPQKNNISAAYCCSDRIMLMPSLQSISMHNNFVYMNVWYCYLASLHVVWETSPYKNMNIIIVCAMICDDGKWNVCTWLLILFFSCPHLTSNSYSLDCFDRRYSIDNTNMSLSILFTHYTRWTHTHLVKPFSYE